MRFRTILGFGFIASSSAVRMSSSRSSVVYSYGAPLIDATFFERTNRFECKVKEMNGESGEVETDVYCPNTGSMLSLVPTPKLPLRKCVLSTSASGKRKHIHTLEAVEEQDALVGIHSRLANDMVSAALQQNLIAELEGFTELNREVMSVPSTKNKKDGNSRTDFELVWRREDEEEGEERREGNPFADFAYQEGEAGEQSKKKGPKKKARNTSDKGVNCRMLVEVKSVTLSLDSESAAYGKRNAQFPDCVSTRAAKHLRSLMDHLETKSGSGSGRKDRAMVFFLIQRDDVETFSPCHLDTAYTTQLELAIKAGVEVLCYTTKLDPATGDVHWGRRVAYKANPLPPAAPSSSSQAPEGAPRKRKR